MRVIIDKTTRFRFLTSVLCFCRFAFHVAAGSPTSIPSITPVATPSAVTAMPIPAPIGPPMLPLGTTISPTMHLPGNEMCDGATAVALNESINGSLPHFSFPTMDICQGLSENAGGLWYKFIGTGDWLTCELPTDLTFGFAVYNGTCGSLSCVSIAGFLMPTTKGESYYVHLYGADVKFEFTLTKLAPPANDYCVSATPISPGLQGIDSNTNAATPDDVPACGSNPNNSSTPGVWYKFKSSSEPTPYSVVAEHKSLSVFSGTCNKLVCVGGDARFYEANTGVTWESESAEDFYILVNGYNYSGFSEEFTLYLNEVAATPTISPQPVGQDVVSAPAFVFSNPFPGHSPSLVPVAAPFPSVQPAFPFQAPVALPGPTNSPVERSKGSSKPTKNIRVNPKSNGHTSSHQPKSKKAKDMKSDKSGAKVKSPKQKFV